MDLLVKVSGYFGRFVGQYNTLQDDILNQAEFRIQ